MATLKKNSLVNYVGTVYDLKNPCKVMRDTDTDLMTVQLEDMNGIEQRVSGGYVEPLENSDQEDTSDRFMEGAHVNYIGDNEDWANPCILDMLDDNGSVARIIDNDGEVGYVPLTDLVQFKVGDKVEYTGLMHVIDEPVTVVEADPSKDFIQAETSDGDVKTMNIKNLKLVEDNQEDAGEPEDIEAVEQTEGTDQDDEPEAEQNQDTEATDQEAQTEEPDQQDEEPEFSFNIGDRVELVFRPDWIGTVIETSSETVHPYRVQFDNNITALYEKFDLRPHEDDQQDEPQGVYIPAIDDPKPKHSKVKLTQLMQYGSPIIVNNEDTPEALTEDTEEPDMVNHPPHYNIHNMETIDAIEQTMTPDEVRGYYKGNIKKYTDRYRYKDGMKDLGKLVFYSKRLEAFEEKLGELE